MTNQWFAVDAAKWQCGPYLVCFEVRDYSVWLKGKKRLGRAKTLSEAQLLASNHSVQSPIVKSTDCAK